jgi:hypothetical protein
MDFDDKRNKGADCAGSLNQAGIAVDFDCVTVGALEIDSSAAGNQFHLNISEFLQRLNPLNDLCGGLDNVREASGIADDAGDLG